MYFKKGMIFQIVHAHTTLLGMPWDLNKIHIFRHIDTCISRCYDMIEICQAMIDFAR